MSFVPQVVAYRDGFVVVEPEDDGVACIREVKYWSLLDLVGVIFFYGRRYFKTTDKYWWKRISPVEDGSWENDKHGRDEESAEATP